jgi:outer membrane protein assembly factor BamA
LIGFLQAVLPCYTQRRLAFAIDKMRMRWRPQTKTKTGKLTFSYPGFTIFLTTNITQTHQRLINLIYEVQYRSSLSVNSPDKRVFLNRLLHIWLGIFFPVLLFPLEGAGQSARFLKVAGIDDKSAYLGQQEIPDSFADSLSVIQFLQTLRKKLVAEGYLTTSVEAMSWTGDTLTASIDLGSPFEWANLRTGTVPEEYLTRIGYREKFYRDEPFKPASVARIFKGVLDEAENSGYPYAEIGLDSVKISENKIDAVLYFDRRQYVSIDSLILKGNIETSRNYLENYLGIKKDMAYSQRTLSRIPNRLRELPFVQVIKPYEIGMRPGKADVYLYLDSRKASNFNGILGVLPDNLTGDVVITGDVELNLMNALKRGETINMRWQRLQTRTTQLDIRFAYPYMFKTRIGTDLKMNLYRQDTLFSQVILDGALQYFFSGNNSVRVFIEQQQANLISAEFFSADRFVDSRITMYGFGSDLQNLDYRFNPRKGYFLNASIAAGTKVITENSEVDPELYDGINLNSEIYNLNLLTGNYFPIGKRSVVLLRVKAGHFINENMFRNEMYRLGGLKSIRGFDEQAIFASSYAIGTLEFRYLLEQNSNLFVFLDQAYYENSSEDELITDTPFGFGGGINFETGAGVFSLTYALGRQFENNISFRSGKLHFGFISFF